MTSEQIEIGDKLLKLLVEKNGRSDKSQYPVLLEKEGYDYRRDVSPTVQRLIDKKWIEPFQDDYFIRLTDLGYDVANVGIVEHLQKVENRDSLAIQNLELQNEALLYQQRLREKDEEIKELTASNLKLQNNNLKRTILYMILSAVIGAIITAIASYGTETWLFVQENFL